MSFIKDIDTICKTYIHLDAKDIDKYMASIFEKYGINSEEYVINTIRDYCNQLDEEDRQKYQKNQLELRSYHKSIICLMNQYMAKASPKILIELLRYSDLTSLNIFFDSYLKANPDKKLEMDYLKEQLDEIERKLNRFDMYKEYLKSDTADQNIINLISLLFCEDEEKAISLLKDYQFSKEEYNNSLNLFQELFPSQKYNLKYLESIFKQYTSSYSKKITDPVLQKNIELMKDMVASNYSVLEYLSYHGGYNIGEMNRIFSEIRSLNIPEYKDMLNLLNNRSDEAFFKHLDNLILEIYNKENFELMDYYHATKIGIDYFRKYVLNKMEDSEIKKDVLHKLSLIWDFSRIHSEIRESSITGVTIIKGVTINVEEKQKIYNYLKQNGLPLIDTTFKYYVRKYANGEFDLEKQMN